MGRWSDDLLSSSPSALASGPRWLTEPGATWRKPRQRLPIFPAPDTSATQALRLLLESRLCEEVVGLLELAPVIPHGLGERRHGLVPVVDVGADGVHVARDQGPGRLLSARRSRGGAIGKRWGGIRPLEVVPVAARFVDEQEFPHAERAVALVAFDRLAYV